jgi:hypothetical protein
MSQAGKSSFVNSLLRKSTFAVYNPTSSSPGPNTTIYPQEITIEAGGSKIRVIDTPGISWNRSNNDNQNLANEDVTRTRDILLRNKGRIDRLKDPTTPGLYSTYTQVLTTLTRECHSCPYCFTIKYGRPYAAIQPSRLRKGQHRSFFVWGCKVS